MTQSAAATLQDFVATRTYLFYDRLTGSIRQMDSSSYVEGSDEYFTYDAAKVGAPGYQIHEELFDESAACYWPDH